MDDVFRVLSKRSRREVLTEIMEDNPQWPDEFEADELQLHHSHLPALEAAGFIEWDRRTNTIVRGEDFKEIRPLLELMIDHEDELPDDWP